jgi:ankyrin repeat protein
MNAAKKNIKTKFQYFFKQLSHRGTALAFGVGIFFISIFLISSDDIQEGGFSSYLGLKNKKGVKLMTGNAVYPGYKAQAKIDEAIVKLVRTCSQNIAKAHTILEKEPGIVHQTTEIGEAPLSLLIRWFSPEDSNLDTHLEAVKMLLDFGADVNASNGCGDPPLINAIIFGQMKVIKLLLARGAKLKNLSGFMGNTVLHAAVMSGDTNILELLILKGADLEAGNEFEQPPLHYAASDDKYFESMKVLIAHGASLNSLDGFGCTPLHNACLHGCIRNAKYLVEAGASLSIQDSKGRTPSQLAFEESQTQIHAFLEGKQKNHM